MNTRKNIVLGAFLITSLSILTLVSLYLTDQWFGKRQEWIAYFGEDSIVREGYEIWSGGIKVGVIDEIISEPLGGAHRDHRQMAATLKGSLIESLKQLTAIPPDELQERRYQKFRCMGVFDEG